MNEREVFLSALEFEEPESRRAHLQSLCGDDAELLARVEALLDSHECQSQFLNTPAVDQLAGAGEGELVDQPPPTVLHDSGSHREDGLEGVRGSASDPETVVADDEHSDDEVALGYLKPSMNPDALGRLAHYEIHELLGRGAFGTVLKAFDEKLQRVVAIKVLSVEMAATSPARKRFLREARSSAAVRHENVVSIYAVEDEPIPYLVMEYIPGKTLQQRLDEHGPLDLPDVLRLGKQVAEGLAAAHAQGLIHRDIKPGNILLETSIDDHVKITDFGLARTADDASMTQSGLIAGTPMYMAPEQALGRKLDQRADLFSLGSVLYQMLSGRPPFRAPSTIAVLKRVAEDPPRPIREIIPEVPEWMCELIGHLHAKDPDQRYGSAKEVAELLGRCLTDVREGRKPSIPSPTPRADEPANIVEPTHAVQPLFQRPFAKVAALVLLLVVGLGAAEATGISELTSTLVRLTTGSGTLVIETDDPGVKIAIDGEEVTIQGAGVEEVTLRPGEYEVAAFKNGEPVRQELVSITRNGRTVVRIGLEAAVRPAIGPFTDADVERISALPAAAQIEEVRKALMLRNPGFDGKVSPTFEDDTVTELACHTHNVTDISPVRALVHLKRLVADGSSSERGLLSDLSPLRGMQLTYLNVNYNPNIRDLEPLRGMPLKILWAYECPISDLTPLEGMDLKELYLWLWTGTDLTPLKGMPLKRLNAGGNNRIQDLEALAGLPLEYLCINLTRVSDLTPLKGSPLESLSADGTQISDLSPLAGLKLKRLTCVNSEVSDLSILQEIPLKELNCDFQPARDTEILRSIVTLEKINDKPAAEFWKEFDEQAALPAGSKWSADAPPLAVAPFDRDEAKAHQKAWAKYLGVPEEKEIVLGRNRLGQDVTLSLVLIPPGEFLMGTSPDDIDRLREQAPTTGLKVEDVGRINLEGPQHRVQITRPFYMSRNEFTTDQFRSFVQAQPGEYLTEPEKSGKGAWAAKPGVAELDPELNWKRAVKRVPQGPDSPVVNVTWNDANDCCEWLSQQDTGLAFALPTEAQWEYACRAGTTTLWSTGDEQSSLEGYAVFKANWPKNIGDRLPNAFGLCDMHGNVWEWCQDAFYDYRDAGSVDPLGKVSGEFRIIRGGSCFDGTGITRNWQENSGCRSAVRDVRKPDNPLLQIGFRVAAAIADEVLAARTTGVASHPTGSDTTLKPADAADAGWVSLFNGRDLTGWKTLSELPGQWEVKDGILTGSAKPSYLFSERGDLANFHLRAEIRINGLGDAGLWFRAPYAFRHGPQAWMVQPATGYEAELNDLPHPLGTIWQVFGEAPPQVLAVAATTPDHPVGEWFTLEVIAESNHLITKVNGHEAVNLRDKFNRFSVGHLALAVTRPETVLEMRQIEIRELPPTSAPPPTAHEFASGEWIDVLRLIDPQLDKWDMRSTGENKWRIEQGELVAVADEKPSKLLLPLDADNWKSFDCELDITRRAGEMGFNLNIPTGTGDSPLGFDRPDNPGINLFVRQKGPVSLSDTRQIETGQRTTLRIEVRPTEEGDLITVWNNNVQVGSWTGNRNQLAAINNEGYAHHRRLSLWIHAGGNEFVFHRIRVRMLDGGTAESLRPISLTQDGSPHDVDQAVDGEAASTP